MRNWCGALEHIAFLCKIRAPFDNIEINDIIIFIFWKGTPAQYVKNKDCYGAWEIAWG